MKIISIKISVLEDNSFKVLEYRASVAEEFMNF